VLLFHKWTVLEGISGIGGGETGSGATVRMIRKEAGSKGAKIGMSPQPLSMPDDEF